MEYLSSNATDLFIDIRAIVATACCALDFASIFKFTFMTVFVVLATTITIVAHFVDDRIVGNVKGLVEVHFPSNKKGGVIFWAQDFIGWLELYVSQMESCDVVVSRVAICLL